MAVNDGDALEGEIVETDEQQRTRQLSIRDRATVRPGQIPVETGRGNAVMVDIGAPIMENLDRIADQANYGGDYRVYLNGNEMLSEQEFPHDQQSGRQTFQAGQRWAITAYDKPGLN